MENVGGRWDFRIGEADVVALNACSSCEKDENQVNFHPFSFDHHLGPIFISKNQLVLMV